MINVVKNRTRLCALTTSVLFFLQGMDICIGESSLLRASSPQESSCKAQDNEVSPRQPIFCQDSGSHTITGGSIEAKAYGEYAVRAEGQNVVINVNDVSIKGKSLSPGVPGVGVPGGAGAGPHLLLSPNTILEEEEDSVGAAVFASSLYEKGTEIDLQRPSIEGFHVGLRAAEKGKVNMKGGAITKTYLGALADLESSIVLYSATVDVSGIGLLSMGQSIVKMLYGGVKLGESGVGVMSAGMGYVVLHDVRISGSELKQNGLSVSPEQLRLRQEMQEKGLGGDFVVPEPKRHVLLSSGGFISFNNGIIDVSDASVISVNDHFQSFAVNDRNESMELVLLGDEEDEEDEEEEEEEEEVRNAVQGALSGGVYKLPSITEGDGEDEMDQNLFDDISSVMTEIAEVTKAADPEAYSVLLNGGAVIRSSTIKARGMSYGIHFNGFVEKPEEFDVDDIDLCEKDEPETYSVLLKDTTLRLPSGVAIYGDNLKGHVVVTDDSTLSGDLLLKAESYSDLSVFVHDSLLMGAARVDENSRARLFLSGGTEWHLTKSSASSNLEQSNADCIDSCISSIQLVNSNIRFFSLTGGEGNKYQTLRIGSGGGRVYNALETSKIIFNADLMPSEDGNAQVSDRLLIHGDVSGKTLVAVNAVSSRAPSGQEALNGRPYSVSLIQVYGQAAENSFQLDGGYITLNGLPYRYTLRAYGSNSATKFFDPKLKSVPHFWDYRLENQYVTGEVQAQGPQGQAQGSHAQGQSAAVVPRSSQPEGELRVEVSGVSRESQSVAGAAHASPSTSASVSASQPNLLGRSEEDGDAATLGTSSDSEAVTRVPSLSRSIGSSPSSLGRSEPDEESMVSSTATTQVATSTPVTEASGAVGSISSSSNGVSATSPIVSGGSQASGLAGSVPLVTLARSETVVSTPSTVSEPPVARVLSAASEKSAVTRGSVGVATGCDNTNTSYSCNDGRTHTINAGTLKVSDNNQHSIHANKTNTVINVERTTIVGAASSNLKSDVNELRPMSAVLAEENAEVVLSKESTVQSSLIGLEAQRGGKVKMTDGAINATYAGVLVGPSSSVNLSNTRVNLTGDLAVAALASNAGQITVDSGVITLTNGVAVRSESGGNVTLDRVNIIAKRGQNKPNSTEKRAAFLLSDRGSVGFANGNVVTDANALWIRNNGDVVESGSSRTKRSSQIRSSVNYANIEYSTIRVEGDESYGIYFDGMDQRSIGAQNHAANRTPIRHTRSVNPSVVSSSEKAPVDITGVVSLKKTDFEVLKSIAIYGNNSSGRVSIADKAHLSGDLLLRSENSSNLSVSVDDSLITGGARVDRNSYAKFDLSNGAQWILTKSRHQLQQSSNADCSDSCISSINLANSSIKFVLPTSGEHQYQTLRIGKGSGTVYSASGASIYFNARLDPSDPTGEQVTDRLLIHGDVSGKTLVHVQAVSASMGKNNGSDKVAHSVSIIQVYGQAQKDSFQLNGKYVALQNSPYKYTLRSYGPETTSAEEHVSQKFMKDGRAFWNFRLENQYVESSDPKRTSLLDSSTKTGFVSHSGGAVRSVVPQVPTYLLLPNSLFHAGLMDISNQNKQLEVIRIASSGMAKVHENPALFLRSYGGHYRYASDLSALEYGYGGDLGYKAIEASALLQTIESMYGTMSFGVMGTYGKLSLQPQDVEYSQKSVFDKWIATAYATMQHDAGFYVDGLFSYGLLKGDVLTLARDKTATLKSKPLSVSLTGGQPLATGYKGFVFDPQVQVVYQNLQFDQARDIDNFDIEMGRLDQWVARVGGRLIKTPTGSEGVNAVAFYSKLYLTHAFGKEQTVHFKDAFKLGAFGSSFEAGLGFNAKLLPQFSLHADVLYQHKLNKAGFSGTSFSGGIRYQF
ncbi:autotransporter outer membrane beta-barrel domain-containing protein [Bartonella sp. OT172YNZD]|uniref:autotransporter outer membrane beta-barrel domain-containing protein n=1 Tax=Bartonella sp. OT172YNZD TaxID=3243572 RepID=UPI0035CF0E59